MSKEGEILTGREILVNTDAVPQEADLAPGLRATRALAEQAYSAALKGREAGEDTQSGGLPCSVSAEQS